MPAPDVEDLAAALQLSIGLLVRRMKQTPLEDDLTPPESSALARLDRDGPTTAGALAKLERISPQSIGATLAVLEQRGLIRRTPDPDDGRRFFLSPTDAGRATLRTRRSARAAQLAAGLSEFTRTELDQLMRLAPLLERLAQSL